MSTIQASPFTLRGRSAARAIRLAGAMACFVALGTSSAHARGGSSITVATTGAVVPGSAVSGVVTITNGGSKAVTVSAVEESLEVRFPTDNVPPGLPAGSTSGWYGVVTVALPRPGPIAAGATVQIPYRIETCGGGVLASPGAKDMRSAAAVSVTAEGTTLARSLNYPLPGKCPVCGNGIVEYGEQCEGGGCCSGCRIVADGTACVDGNACTLTDRCRAGACVGSGAVVCEASDQCHVAGTCSPTTGLCSDPVKTWGSACDDGNACTLTDTCQGGFCSGGNPIVCAAPDQCHAGACDPGTGACSVAPKADGTACDDGDACTVDDACVTGACAGGGPRECTDHLSCTDDACDVAAGCVHKPAPTCDVCDVAECLVCGDLCDAANAQCVDGCWLAFWSCLNGCTTTYCAPFCQFDLGRCIDACPATAPCRSGCEAGNGCAAGCVEPE